MARTIRGIGPETDLTDDIGGPGHRVKSIYVGELVSSSRILVDDIAVKIPATTTNAGLMSASDKARLDGLYPTGSLVFYCDPNGDSSLNTPGTAAAPFKSLMTALAALRKRYGGLGGYLHLRFNPGEYQAESVNINALAYGFSDLFLASVDTGNPAVIQCNGALTLRNGYFSISGLRLRAANGFKFSERAFVLTEGAVTLEVIGESASLDLVTVENGSTFKNHSCALTIEKAGDACGIVFAVYSSSILDAYNTTYTFPSLRSCSLFACARYYSYYCSQVNTSFIVPEGFAGQRFMGANFGYFYVAGAGANYFPGSTAGWMDTTSAYT